MVDLCIAWKAAVTINENAYTIARGRRSALNALRRSQQLALGLLCNIGGVARIHIGRARTVVPHTHRLSSANVLEKIRASDISALDNPI